MREGGRRRMCEVNEIKINKEQADRNEVTRERLRMWGQTQEFISTKEKEIEDWTRRKEDIYVTSGVARMDVISGSSAQSDPVPAAAILAEQRKKEYDAKIAELHDQIKQRMRVHAYMSECISSLDATKALIIKLIYETGSGTEEIAGSLNYSPRWIRQLEFDAVCEISQRI